MKMHLCTTTEGRWRCIKKNYLWASLQWMIYGLADKLKPWNLQQGSNGSSAGSASATVAGLVPLPLVQKPTALL
jgi:hypothetical protein